MLVDTLTLITGAEVVNMTLASGTSDPGSPTVGELFYRTDLSAVRVYSGSVWSSIGSGGGSGTVTSIAVSSANGALSISGSPITTSGTITVTANTFTTSVAGVVPGSGGGSTNFLRADGTWSAPPGASPSLTATQIGFGNGSNLLSGSTNLTWDGTTFEIAGAASAPVIEMNTGTGGTIQVGTGPTPGPLVLRGGLAQSAGGGQIQVVAGAGSAGNDGGSVVIQGGAAGSGPQFGGEVVLNTGTGANNGTITLQQAGVSRFQITQQGAYNVGSSGAGTSGQVIMSNGATLPSWASVATALGYTPVNKTGDSMSGALTFPGTSGNTVTGLPTPINSSDAVNKAYADAIANGLSWKNAVKAATTANLTAAYVGSPTFTLTNSSTQAAFATDGYSASSGDRILVKNQTLSQHNGIYSVTTVGSGSTNWVLTRTSDFNETTPIDEVNGAAVYVDQGTLFNNTSWTQIDHVVTFDTDPIAFTQFASSGGGVSSLTGGTGISVSASTGAITVTNTGVTEFNTRTGNVTLTSGDVTTALGFTPGTVTSVAVASANGALTVTSGSPITGSGTITLTANNYSTSTTTAGVVPGSNGGGSTVFLNGNGGWTVPVGDHTATLTTGRIGFGASGFLSSSANLLWTESSQKMDMGDGTTAPIIEFNGSTGGTLQTSNTSDVTPGALNIRAGQSAGTSPTVVITGGTSSSASSTGGAVIITGGAGSAPTGVGGSVQINTGTPNGGANGVINFQLNGTTAFRITNSGAFGLGSGISVGSSGQVLTSAGTGSGPTWTTPAAGTVTSVALSSANGGITITSGSPITSSGTIAITSNLFSTAATTQGDVPGSNGATTSFLRGDGTWATPAGAATLNSTLVGYGNGSNVLTGTSDFTWTDSTHTLSLEAGSSTPTILGSTQGGLTITGGAANAGTFISPGPLTIQGTASSSGGTSIGGNVVINGGTSATTTGGSIVLQTQVGTGSALVQRFVVNSVGAFGIGGTTVANAAYGTSGQVLTSGGSGAIPTWATPPAGSSITGSTGASGGTASVTGGTATAGTGGAVTLTSTAGVGTNQAGGAMTLSTGAATGSGTAGAFGLTSGAGGSTGTGGNITITSGAGGSTSGAAGVITLSGGNSNTALSNALNNNVASIYLQATSSQATAANGSDILIASGSPAGSPSVGGNIVFRTGGAVGGARNGTFFFVNGVGTQFLTINGVGAIGVNGASFGTAGQVLTSNTATGATTWANAPSGALTNTQIGYGVGGVVAGSADLTFTVGTETMLIGSATTAPTITSAATTTNSLTFNIKPAQPSTATNVGTIMAITGGAGGSTSGAGGAITLTGGASASGVGGAANLVGGVGVGNAGGGVNITGGSTNNNTGGTVTITGGATTTSGTGGAVVISAGTPTGGNGGNVTLTATAGNAGGAQGGAISITTGAGQGTAGAGGNLSFITGASGGTAAAGSTSFTMGANAGGGGAGAFTVTAGNATTVAGTGGAISFTTGSASISGGAAGGFNVTTGSIVTSTILPLNYTGGTLFGSGAGADGGSSTMIFTAGASTGTGASYAGGFKFVCGDNTATTTTGSVAGGVLFQTGSASVDAQPGMFAIVTGNAVTNNHTAFNVSGATGGTNSIYGQCGSATSGVAGGVAFVGGVASASGGTAGGIYLTGGKATASGASAGNVVIATGTAVAGATAGSITFQTGTTASANAMTISSAGVVTITNLATGNLTSVSGVITSSSDIRLKQNIRSFDRGFEALQTIEPITYNFTEASGIPTDVDVTGFSAQNVQESIPEAISVGKDGYLGLSDRPIIAALVNAVKAQQKQIDELKTLVTALTGNR